MKTNSVLIKTALAVVALWSFTNNAQQWGNVVHLQDLMRRGETSRQAYDRIIAENENVVVKFYLTNCPPCKALAPEFSALAQQHKNILFIEIECSEYNDLAEQLAIRSVPTLIVYKNHQKISSKTGGNKEWLRSEVRNLLH